MIYFDTDFSSIIESIYLNERISSSLSRSNVIVNPIRLDYLFGKTIVINDPDYNWSNATILSQQRCKIISRLDVSFPNVDVNPYIIRINTNIMWNGEELDLSDKNMSMSDIFNYLVSDDENDYSGPRFRYNENKCCLYFPKLKIKGSESIKDLSGNLTALGWALHQVGVNQVDKFINMDLLKTKKIFC